jgi:hypothetical protein
MNYKMRNQRKLSLKKILTSFNKINMEHGGNPNRLVVFSEAKLKRVS